jgi:hypothetical protein|tara:strand:- start:165 stop:344 length:180 start_codon:yes stop_codon:yes gene_type:complete
MFKATTIVLLFLILTVELIQLRAIESLDIKGDVIYEELIGHSLKWDNLHIWGIEPEVGQ